MRITSVQELGIVGVLIAYLAFTNGLQVVRTFLSNPVGKAIGLAAIVWVWKCVSPLIALLLAINFVRCAGGSMREGLASGVTYTCPEGTTAKPDMPGKCAKIVNGMEVLVDGTASGTTEMPPPPVVTMAPPAVPPATTTPTPPEVPSTPPMGAMSSTTSFSPVV
jgi:hypothetical protein